MSKRMWAGLILLVIPLIILLLTLVREKTENKEILFSLPSGESGTIVIGIPERIWSGDIYAIRATVAFSSSPSTEIPAILVGRLETGVEELRPRGEIRLGMDSGSPVTFEWVIKGSRAASYPGTLWLWIETDENHQLLLARDFTITARNLLGMQLLNYRIGAALVALAGLMVTLYSAIKQNRAGKSEKLTNVTI